MVLGKLSVPGRPTNLDNSRARAYCTCSRCGWGLFGHFFSSLSFLFFSPSFGAAPYRLKYCLKRAVKPKKTNQPASSRGSLPGGSSLVNSSFAVVNKGGAGRQKSLLRELVLNWWNAVYHTWHSQKLITCMYRMF